jgi:hypothetical protein
MLSRIIKDKIELKYGQKVKYPKDCDALALEISEVSKHRISGSTIRRLFGFVSGTQEPRRYTLDVVAEYLGCSCFDELINQFNDNSDQAPQIIERIDSKSLVGGTILKIALNQNNYFKVLFKGDNTFEVIESCNCILQNEDEVNIDKILLHHPLFVAALKRSGQNQDPFVLAKISGVYSIELL